MDELIANFPNQLRRSIEIGETAELSKPQLAIHNVLITGLGGSGIGGTIVSELLRDEVKVPVVVNKEYFLPAFVNENTLVIVSSYSGNTEETYNALQQAFKKDAKIVCITSGGKVKDFAECNGLDFILIDGGMPPRSCFGYSFVQQLFVFIEMGLIPDKHLDELRSAIELIVSESEDIKRIARKTAADMLNTIPVIYCDSSIEGVAVRFRQQINENAKMLCWHHVIPEMNHNELVGWRNKYEDLSVVFLRNDNDYERNQQRMEFTKEVAANYAGKILEVHSRGESKIEKAIYLIHLTDWVSYYLAELGNRDAIEVDVITKLKDKLASLPMS